MASSYNLCIAWIGGPWNDYAVSGGTLNSTRSLFMGNMLTMNARVGSKTISTR